MKEIKKPFCFDKSRIPTEKLGDPRLVEKERIFVFRMQDQAYRLASCLHEAAHAVYAEKSGAAEVRLLPPQVLYNAETDEFIFWLCAVQTRFEPTKKPEAFDVAKWCTAGRVAEECLISKEWAKQWSVDKGDSGDFVMFCEKMKTKGYGLLDHEITALWQQARCDVEKDLRSPSFRRQLWERARGIEKELLNMFSTRLPVHCRSSLTCFKCSSEADNVSSGFGIDFFNPSDSL